MVSTKSVWYISVYDRKNKVFIVTNSPSKVSKDAAYKEASELLKTYTDKTHLITLTRTEVLVVSS